MSAGMEGATIQQSEELACSLILDFAKTFYQDPVNLKAFQAWKKSKEEKNNGANQNRDHL